jgi:acyl transferase domain-containing protein/acyl carrier protein
VVGPESDIVSLRNLASNQGLVTQRMHLSGKVHNPENTALAHHLKNVCTSQAEFQLPGATSLKASLRSNRTAQSLSQTSLTDEAIETVLASPCQWYDILIAMSKDLTKTTQTSHRIASFGLANCISVGVFEQAGLQIAKLDTFPAPRELPPPIVNVTPACPQLDPIAVVGMACRLPGANNVEELWDLLAAGKSMAEEVPKGRVDIHKIFRASQDAKWASRQRFYGNFISDVEAFDNAFFRTNPREAVMMDPQQRLLLETAYQAMESSGYLRNHRRKDGDNVGVFIGASFTEYLEHTCSHPPTGYTSTGTIRAFLCGKISYYFGWSGPSEIIDTACSSSLVAIHRACKAIQMGECHSAIAGGVNIMTTATNFMDLGKAGFLSPTGQCKPFDAAADGYCRSEGVGLIVLKRLSQAMADGDNILAVVPGIATNQGGLSPALTIPSSPLQITLYKTILNQAGIDSAQVSYVEAHGTGTQAGDPLEVASIRQVFGGKTRQNELSIGSIKANLGHCETAAGVAGVIKAILMINKKHLPPLANFGQLNPKIPDLQPDRMSIATKLTPWESNFRAVCVNSYGAGGSNAAALLCQPPVNVPAAKNVKEEIPYPVMISASSKESFDLYIGTLGRYVSKLGTEFTTGNLALALDMRRRHHKYLWTSVLTNKADFRTIQQASQNLAELPQDIKNVVLSFSGQSRQTIGLDEQLYKSCHLFRSHIDHCDRELTQLGNKPLIPAIFKKDNISDIVTLQCGSFAVQYASAMSWIDSGLKVAAVIGHSFGELTAMAVSGVLDLKSALSIVSARAKLMQTVWGSEPGSMLAVHEPLATVRDIISSVLKGDIEIEIACYNSNSSHVLVGSSDAISRVEESLQANSRFSNVKFARLNVTHGFHSRFTERLLKPLEEVASSKVFHSAKIPLESCTFESLTEVSPARIAQHTREPVYFYQAVHRLEQRLGSCFFLEAGMESPIVPMIKRSAKNPEKHTFQTLSSTLSQPFLSSLAKATATMLSEGISVSHWLFHTPQSNGLKHIWIPPYQFERTRHWLPFVDRAMEALESRPVTVTEVAEKQEFAPIKLVTQLDDPNTYSVASSCPAFVALVTGHSVLNQPLCPASMYMECATMSAHSQIGKIARKSLWFENLNIEAPLGLDSNRDVFLSLSREGIAESWSFVVTSKMLEGKQKSTSHSKGRFGFIDTDNASRGPQAQHYQGLVKDRMDTIMKNPEAETLRHHRAYALFSRVVRYGGFLKGIKNITILGFEAVAEVNVPAGPVTVESTVTNICDAGVLDNFIQVAGLLINTSDICSVDEVFLAVGVNSIYISAESDFVAIRDWDVYVSVTPENNSKASANVYVLAKDGKLLVTINGVQFSKLPLTKLNKLLESVNQGPNSKSDTKSNPRPQVVLTPSTSQSSADITLAEVDNEEGDDGEDQFRELLSTFVEISAEPIPNDTNMGELGIDSLAASEFAENLESTFGAEVDMAKIVEMTYGELRKLVMKDKAPKISVSVPASCGRPGSKSRLSGPRPEKISKLLVLISEHSGRPVAAIDQQSSLDSLGVDSLSIVELKSEIEDLFGVELGDDFGNESTIAGLLKDVGQGSSDINELVEDHFQESSQSSSTELTKSLPSMQPLTAADWAARKNEPPDFEDPVQALSKAGDAFERFLARRSIPDYWAVVAPMQDELMLAYIAEAFRNIGVDLWEMEAGCVVPNVGHLPTHAQLMARLWDILIRLGIVESKSGSRIRTSKQILPTPSGTILREIVDNFPAYAGENNLMACTGSKLAACLTGKQDPIRLLFGNAEGMELLNQYYGYSPQLSIATETLVDLMERIFSKGNEGGIRILEVGGGFGGTTTSLAKMLNGLGRPVQYTFTDVSPKLVKAAKAKFAQYKWMEFQALDLEKDPPAKLQGQYDVVLGTNVVHATADVVQSSIRIRSLLRKGGFLVLSEVTQIIDWYDLVFGLLSGWWAFTDGRDYPLQPPDVWMRMMKDAGFKSSAYSGGSGELSNSHKIIIASMNEAGASVVNGIAKEKSRYNYKTETVTYKHVNGLDIQADIYFSNNGPPSRPMPIGKLGVSFTPFKIHKLNSPKALLVHGGGFMTFSKSVIRPWQIPLLLDEGIIPVSIDYRLCPEVGIDVAMEDVRDSLVWARKVLPGIVKNHNAVADPERVVMIGWSTGATLAMSSAWTAAEVGVKPPAGILNFYGPSDFEHPCK